MKNVRYYFFMLGIVLFMQSCGSMASKYSTVKVHTGTSATLVVNSDTISMLGTWHPITAERSKNPLQVVVLNDSLPNQMLSIKSRPSIAFYLNPFKYPLLIKDWNTPQKFTYPANIYLTKESKTQQYRTFNTNAKGDILLHVSLPQLNSFLMQPAGYKVKSNTGFLGVSLGADYYYRENRYFNLTFGAITDFFLPIPVPIHSDGAQEVMHALYFTASDNYVTGRISFGYGVLLTNNIWRVLENTRDPQFPNWPEPVTRNSLSTGLVLSTYYRASKSFNIGIVYRPSILQLNPQPALKYEHSLSLDLAWKFML